MTLTQTTTHVKDAKALLIEQYRGKVHLEGLLSSFVSQIQVLEDVLFDLLLDRYLTSSSGEQLDLLGRIVGQPRDAKSDADYRLWLRARIRVNISSGTPEDLLAIFNIVADNDVELKEWYPAGLSMVVAGAFPDAAVVASILSQARPAGVGASLEYTLADDESEPQTFAFAAGDTAEESEEEGWNEDTGETTGGKFADVIGM
jgi:hypothetical protein